MSLESCFVSKDQLPGMADSFAAAGRLIEAMLKERSEIAQLLGVKAHEVVGELRRLAELLLRCSDCHRLTDHPVDPQQPEKRTVCPECLEARR